MSILKFGIISLVLYFSNLDYSFGKPIQGPKLENLDPELKNSIDSEIKKENWSTLCQLELNLDAMRKQLNEEGQNRIDVAKNYIVNQTGENYQEIQNACLHQNVSTSIVPMTSTMTEKTTSIL